MLQLSAAVNVTKVTRIPWSDAHNQLKRLCVDHPSERHCYVVQWNSSCVVWGYIHGRYFYFDPQGCAQLPHHGALFCEHDQFTDLLTHFSLGEAQKESAQAGFEVSTLLIPTTVTFANVEAAVLTNFAKAPVQEAWLEAMARTHDTACQQATDLHVISCVISSW